MLTKKEFIFSIEANKSKEEILDLICDNILKNKVLEDKKELYEAFVKRESEFSTGIGEGIAIPHAEIDGIEAPIVSVVRVNNIDWGAIDNKPVTVAIAIVVPKGGRGEHLQILSELSKNMIDPEFQNTLKTGTEAEVEKIINSVSISSEDESEHINDNVDANAKYVVGITACPTGIAHTFMAQKAIIDACKAKGYRVKVETQGSEGPKNALTLEDVHNSDAIVISTSIALEGMEKFNGYEEKIHFSELQNTIANSAKVVEDALEIGKNFTPKADGLKSSNQASTLNFAPKKTNFEAGMGHIMTGITAMIPVLLIAGLLMAIGNIGALAWTLPNQNSIGDSSYAMSSNVWVNLMYYINQIGSIVMKFMYPIFAMYLAYSIAGKLALIPGFMGGVMAAGLETQFLSSDIYSSPLLGWAYPNGFIPSMFFGALFIGAFTGLLTRFLNKKIQVSPNLITLKTMLIIPLIMSVSVFLVMAFLVNPFFGLVNWGMSEMFRAAGDTGSYLYQLSVAAGTAFDLGGPINKAAGAVANGLNTDAFDRFTTALNNLDSTNPASLDEVNAAVSNLKTFNITGRTMAIIIPPIGIGFAAMFGNSITRRAIFTKEEQQLGGQAAFLGFIGISEGAIPMMIKYPAYVILADIIGAMVGTFIAITFGAIQTLPLPAIWGWFLVGTTVQGGAAHGINGIGIQMFGYIFGVVVGAATVATIFISFLLAQDIFEDRKNRVYSKEQLSKMEDSNVAKENSIRSLDMIIEYYQNQLAQIGGNEKASFEKLNTQQIEEYNISFSKLKVAIGRELKYLAKLKYMVMKNDSKSRVIDQKLEYINNEEKIAKLNGLKDTYEVQNQETEKLIVEEQNKVSSYINSQIYILEKKKEVLQK